MVAKKAAPEFAFKRTNSPALIKDKTLTAGSSGTVSVGWLKTTHRAQLINYQRTDGYQMRLSIKLLQPDRVHVWSRQAQSQHPGTSSRINYSIQKLEWHSGSDFLSEIFRQKYYFAKQFISQTSCVKKSFDERLQCLLSPLECVVTQTVGWFSTEEQMHSWRFSLTSAQLDGEYRPTAGNI